MSFSFSAEWELIGENVKKMAASANQCMLWCEWILKALKKQSGMPSFLIDLGIPLRNAAAGIYTRHLSKAY